MTTEASAFICKSNQFSCHNLFGGAVDHCQSFLVKIEVEASHGCTALVCQSSAVQSCQHLPAQQCCTPGWPIAVHASIG